MTHDPGREAERSMEEADEANGESPDPGAADRRTNDTEQRYGHDESPT